MIVVDSSALVCVLLQEPDYVAYETALATADGVTVPASCLLEASIVVRQRGVEETLVRSFMAALTPTILPFDERQADIAVAADRRFGRATGHPARLNFGDCMAYAAAVALDAPLLFKGDDFALTDVRRAEV